MKRFGNARDNGMRGGGDEVAFTQSAKVGSGPAWRSRKKVKTQKIREIEESTEIDPVTTSLNEISK